MKKNIFYRLITITLISISCSGTNTRNFSYQRENQPRYEAIPDSNFLSTKKTNKSYFPLEVSTYSYTNFKESVENGYYPTKIYTEELLNSFAYNFDKPMNGKKMGLHLEAAISPWDEKRKLIQIGINSINEEKKEEVESPAKNIIFAVDTSGDRKSVV